MLENLNIVNSDKSELEEELEVGGNWACVIGCGTFCIMLEGIATYIAAAATAL